MEAYIEETKIAAFDHVFHKLAIFFIPIIASMLTASFSLLIFLAHLQSACFEVMYMAVVSSCLCECCECWVNRREKKKMKIFRVCVGIILQLPGKFGGAKPWWIFSRLVCFVWKVEPESSNGAVVGHLLVMFLPAVDGIDESGSDGLLCLMDNLLGRF